MDKDRLEIVAVECSISSTPALDAEQGVKHISFTSCLSGLVLHWQRDSCSVFIDLSSAAWPGQLCLVDTKLSVLDGYKTFIINCRSIETRVLRHYLRY